MRLASLALLSIWCLAPPEVSAQEVDFVRDIQPVLERSCAGCHGPAQQLGQLRLDSRQSLLHGGASQGVITPGDAENSPLYRRVAGLGAGARMPMGGELPASEIELIGRWIEQGATWPEATDSTQGSAPKDCAFTSPV